jgi:DNA-binding NtrC family response regulator
MAIRQERVLLVDANPIFRDALADCLQAEGFEIVLAETGERALLILRDRSRPINWLYSRAALPGLVDGWILADEYHVTHPNPAVIVSGQAARPSTRCDIILNQPTPEMVSEVIHDLIHGSRPPQASHCIGSGEHQRAA